jgi:O-methyltransferase
VLQAAADLPNVYLDLVKRALMGVTVGQQREYRPLGAGRDPLRRAVLRGLATRNRVIAEPRDVDPESNPEGTLFASQLPSGIKTMVGRVRLDSVQHCLETVLADDVEGDVIETGVWRGGTTIFMRAVLAAYGVTDRRVVVADSFEGLPPPDLDTYPQDQVFDWVSPDLAVDLATVRQNFRLFGLLDEQVEFVRGWFKDTLPNLKDRTWSLIRLDGDLYESTMDALTNLYPRLSSGGYCIIDDFSIPVCAQAVADYRAQHGIHEEIQSIDWTGVLWRKT